jgi:hypothetical protein
MSGSEESSDGSNNVKDSREMAAFPHPPVTSMQFFVELDPCSSISNSIATTTNSLVFTPVDSGICDTMDDTPMIIVNTCKEIMRH